ncbi:putative iron export permease protein FetB [Streptomyces xanthophaeus]|nr:putative iron export permease protein FetB [Streptomyces xanthophaeus]
MTTGNAISPHAHAAAGLATSEAAGVGRTPLREGPHVRHRKPPLEVARGAASDALLPALDRTRTVGLVALPGAFVGMLLAGASPGLAGAVQVFVLIALLAVETLAIALTLELVAGHKLHRQPDHEHGQNREPRPPGTLRSLVPLPARRPPG